MGEWGGPVDAGGAGSPHAVRAGDPSRGHPSPAETPAQYLSQRVSAGHRAHRGNFHHPSWPAHAHHGSGDPGGRHHPMVHRDDEVYAQGTKSASATLNTSFVERLNLTIRHGSAYLRRRSPCHARGEDPRRGHVELLRCYYNFIRPHRALRFGRETRTPAMQAGLVNKRLAWSDVFTACGLPLRVVVALVHVAVTVQPTESDAAELPTRCSPSALTQAA